MIGAAIPAGPEQLTDEWLTAALRTAGVLDEARVIGHEAELH